MGRVFSRIKSLIDMLKTSGSFVQNFSVVFGGKSVIALLGILTTPILARLYTPESYGLYAIYFAIVANLSILLSLRLPMAFVLIKEEAEFRRLIKSVSGILIVFSLFLSIILAIWNKEILSLLNGEELQPIWYVLVIGIFLHAASAMIGNWNVREKAFRKSTTVSLTEAIGIKSVNLGIGLSAPGYSQGLIWGDLGGKFLSLVVQKFLFVKGKTDYLIPFLSIKEIKRTLKIYWKYPLILLPTSWIAVLANNLVIFYLSSKFDNALLGKFSISTSLIFIPVNLIANSSQPILMQKVAEIKTDLSKVSKSITRYVEVVVYGASICCPVLIITSRPLIDFFLGDQWANTHSIIQILSPTLLFQVLFISLTGVLIALEQKEKLLQIQVFRAVGLIALFVSIHFLDANFTETIILYAIGLSIILIVAAIWILRITKSITTKKLIFPFIVFVSLCTISYIVII